MHFLSHYYHELPNNNPLFVAGLAIPDLTKGFSKNYNSFIKKSVLNNAEDVKEIQNGVEKHYAADKSFHNSPLFIQSVSALTKAFVNEGLNRERLRLSVIGHLACELLIDRQIVLEKEDICVNYYSAINNADEGLLAKYFDLNKMTAEKQSFLTKFRFFKEGRFLFRFKSVESIVEGLSRIYSSVTNAGFTAQESGKFVLALNNNDANIRYSWKELLKP